MGSAKPVKRFALTDLQDRIALKKMKERKIAPDRIQPACPGPAPAAWPVSQTAPARTRRSLPLQTPRPTQWPQPSSRWRLLFSRQPPLLRLSPTLQRLSKPPQRLSSPPHLSPKQTNQLISQPSPKLHKPSKKISSKPPRLSQIIHLFLLNPFIQAVTPFLLPLPLILL